MEIENKIIEGGDSKSYVIQITTHNNTTYKILEGERGVMSKYEKGKRVFLKLLLFPYLCIFLSPNSRMHFMKIITGREGGTPKMEKCKKRHPNRLTYYLKMF